MFSRQSGARRKHLLETLLTGWDSNADDWVFDEFFELLDYIKMEEEEARLTPDELEEWFNTSMDFDEIDPAVLEDHRKKEEDSWTEDTVDTFCLDKWEESEANDFDAMMEYYAYNGGTRGPWCYGPLFDQSNASEEIVDLNQKVTNPSTHIRMYCC